MRFLYPAVGGALLFVAVVAHGKLSADQKGRLPAPATSKVDFARDVKPIFDAACVKCHGKGKAKGGFSLETREAFIKGGDSGAPIFPRQSADSLLIELVSGFDPENVMPKKGSKLKPAQIATLRGWIDQGAAWPEDVTFTKTPIANLQPRRVSPPGGTGLPNPIDQFLSPYFVAHQVTVAPPVEDRIFVRRVYLDLIGLLPSPQQLEAFLADHRPDKRERLVDDLLSDERRYAEHWLTFWNDLLRNDYRGTGYIDGGRKQISAWLYSALRTNMPYNQFVEQLIHPTPQSEGFVNGIVWRGTVNASQKPVMQAAQSIGQVFMGVNLKCASCHDSFINDYTLADSYGIAAIYATNEVEIAECDKPTGQFAKVKFLYSELGEIDGSLPRAERTKRLADILTSREDGRLTRTIVNRFWAKLMGRGLVEPVDEMDGLPWNQDVLDWLAEDLAEHGYDLKRTLRLILTSRAYQMPAVNLGEQTGKDFVFTGPAIRRMNAEEFRDALGQITGVWYDKPAGSFDLGGDARHRIPPGTKWIWSETNADKKALPETIYFRKTVTVRTMPLKATAVIACDNSFTFWVNGQKVSSGKDYQQPGFVDFRPQLRLGDNVFAVAAVNNTPDNKAPRPNQTPLESGSNPAGFVFAGRLEGGEAVSLVSDGTWSWSRKKASGWEKGEFDASNWGQAIELGGANMAPWTLHAKLEQAMLLADVHGNVRASMVAADPLMVALGRPNREQVVTTRQSAATTLQGLEMTNGDTLDKLLKRGAENLLGDPSRPPVKLVSELFVKSLGREPTANEQKLALDLVASEARQQGVEDLLWSIAMHPEFQIKY